MKKRQEVTKGRDAPDDGRLTERTLLNHALELAASADAVAERFGEAAPFFTQLFLLGRSLELALKSFLRKEGAKKHELQKWGHDLEKLLKQAEDRRFPIELLVADREIISLLNALYVSKRLEYLETGSYSTPLTGPPRRLLDKILRGLFADIVGRDMLAKRSALARPTACDLGLRVSPAAKYIEPVRRQR